ncbi:hypothetical protein WR25_00124 [Diploscapter pachys]|uniref:Ionotropic glutamate receptor C-terminal domain-containing protein n=1 Tax=Diploscapter pachys TaxID=2018661 RepID=A0A2A2KT58_9BILA|nr:hypothetical protein WR25_00124 [Diploscapter pachys]
MEFISNPKFISLETSNDAIVRQMETLQSVNQSVIFAAKTRNIERFMELVEVSFYLNIMYFAFKFINTTNSSVNGHPPIYSCEKTTESNAFVLSGIIMKNSAHQYGNYTQQDINIFFINTHVRIYKIDRKNDDDAWFNKQLGFWTPTIKLSTFYGSLDVDVRALNIFRIVTLIQPPFVQYTGRINPRFEGYCIDLIDLVKDEVNFTYTIYEVEDGLFGTTDANGNWNGLIGALVSGSADIALGPLSVMAERENDIDFTVPYYDLVGMTIMMKKTDVEYSLFKFMKVLEWPVWLCILGAYIFTSFLLFAFDRFSPYSYTNNREQFKNEQERRVFSLKECLWFCMTSLTPQGGGEAPKNISGRLVAATWWLFGFIIIASYTANLAAFLTVSRLEQPISIWKEMSLNESMTPKERSRLAVWDYPVSDKFTNMWRYMQESKLPESMDEAINRVLNSVDGFAYIGDATEIGYAALTNCKLQQVGSEFSRKPFAIAVQSGHPLRDPISSAILVLLNQRRLETLKEKWWNNNPNKMTCPDITDQSDGISIENIGGVFIVIAAGIALSIITLAIEFFFYKRRSRNVDLKDTQLAEAPKLNGKFSHIIGDSDKIPEEVDRKKGSFNLKHRAKNGRSNEIYSYGNAAFESEPQKF